jgi:hypothetical protein
LHTATLLPNGKVLVAGGASSQGQTNLKSAELYDPAAGTWAATGNMITARDFHTATLLPNGKVLVVGGDRRFGPHEPLASAELYDPASGTWAATGSLITARAHHTATLLPDGRVLAAGGEDDFSSAELYNPGTGTWTAAGDLITGRSYHTATLLPNGQVLAAGGVVSASLNSAELFTPAP